MQTSGDLANLKPHVHVLATGGAFFPTASSCRCSRCPSCPSLRTGDEVPVIATLRQAVRADVRGIQRVRRSVRDNRLISTTISDAQVVDAIERTGRGWVVEVEGRIVGFAVGNAETGNVWALFVEPGHERRGHGRRLHDEMVGWLRSRGLPRLWLTTEPQTRAQRFYEQAGWENRGLQPSGELLFERQAASRAPQRPTWKDRLGQLRRETHAMSLAARDPRTPWYAKFLLACIVAYALSPIDLIPDFVPVIGFLDDLILIPLGVALAIKLIPAEVLAECRARAGEAEATAGAMSRVAAVVVVGIWVLLAAWCARWAYEAIR